MTWLATLGVILRRYPRIVIGIGALIALAIIAAMLVNRGVQKERARVREASAIAEAQADARKATADANATLSTDRSRANTTRQEQELKHADDAAPSADPSRARLAFACERMRQQGADAATVSKCRARHTRD